MLSAVEKRAQTINLVAAITSVAAILVLVPGLYSLGVLSIEAVNQLGRFLALAIVAIGVDLVWGYTGILSLCQAMFFCLGGYVIGMHMALHGPLDGEGIPRCLYVVTSEVKGFQLPWFWNGFHNFWISSLLVFLIPGLVAYIFGYFTFRSRVKGVYFSIITQATTLGVCLLFRRNEMRLCGTNGLTNFTEFCGFDLTKPGVKLGLYLFTAITLIGVYVACKMLVASRLGKLLVAIRDNESRLRFSGYRPLHFKLFVFTVGAMLAGLGGMLYTPQTGIITPFNMEPEKSVFIVIWVALGGRGTLAGAVIGALVVNYAMSLLTSGTIYNAMYTTRPGEQLGLVQRAFKFGLGPEGWPIVLGMICILVVIFFPKGLMGIWQKMMGMGDDQPHRPAPSAADLPKVDVHKPDSSTAVPENLALTPKGQA